MVPFHSFIIKVASRCNLNCSYCFIYNQADSSWRKQPPSMSLETARATAARIAEHSLAHRQSSVRIIFHGGEPLLLGPAALEALFVAFDDVLTAAGLDCRYGMQSNGTLLDRQTADWLLSRRMSIGISVDGPAHVNDARRVDHAGRPSSAGVQAALSLLAQDKYRPIFGGVLAVIDISSSATQVMTYLSSLGAPMLDLLFPLDNHDRRPCGKEQFEDTPYAEWLIEAFDWWQSQTHPPRVRIFESIIRTICGGTSLVESIGLLPVDLVVVESDGSIEGVDSLKATYEGAAKLGFDVASNTFDEVASHAFVQIRQQGVDGLPDVCKTCGVVKQCGGGYLPHRYSRANSFNNPSIYCRDLEKLIRHIHGAVVNDLVKGGLACTIQSRPISMTGVDGTRA
jgi:uncharacterized protein